MEPQLKIDPGLAEWAVQAIGRLLATFAILQGVNILATGDKRWTGGSFEYALNLPGAPESWGLTLLLTGLVALLATLSGKRRAVVVGQVGIAAWCGFFASSHLLSAWDDPSAPNTGLMCNAVLCLASAVVAAVYRDEPVR